MSKKLIAIVLATTFIISGIAKAETPTIESLMQEIQRLSDLIAQLQGGKTTGTGLCLSTDLSLGMTSAEVKTLQQGLNKDSATQVAVSGAGAPGYETSYFGSLTKAAVIRFQEKYASEVLAPWGLTKGTGFAGSTTRAKFNALYCTPVTPPTTAPETPPTTTPVTATEGTLTASAAAIYTESTLKWGTANQTIYGFKVKAKNSDITLKRIYVNLAGTSFIPWKDLSYISLYEGDNAIKGVEVTKANLVENSFATSYDVYFDGLDVVVAKDTEKTFSIKVTVLSTPENRTSFTIALPQNGIRGVDGAGLSQYNTGSVAGKTLQYEGTRATASIQIKSDSTTPQQGIILGAKDETTKDQTIFKFGLKATNNDAILKTAAITLTQADADLLTAVYLFDGDTRLASVAPTATTSDQTITFPDLNVSIAKDTTKYLTVKVDIAKIDGSTVQEGQAISSIDTAATSSFAFIDANDNNVTSVTGSTTGFNQTVYTAAPVFALTGTPKITLDESTSSTGVAAFTFTVTSKGDTVYIKDDIAWFEATSTSPTYMTVGNGVITPSQTAVGGYYEIDADETVTFTVTYSISAASTTAALVQAQLYNVKWNTSATTTNALNASAIYDFSTWKTNAVNMHD